MPKRSAEQNHNGRQKRKRIILVTDSSDSDDNSNIGTPPPDDVTPIILDESRETQPEPVAEAESTMVLDTTLSIVPAAPSTSGPTTEAPLVPDLDPEILLALGAKTDDGPQYGEKIHENLVLLWTPLLKKGMAKEDKDKIIKEYLIPQNCTLLQAPKLNAEISAAITESARNRDKKMTSTQQQLGIGITAINRAMDLLLSKEENKLKAIKHLSDACRILCDLHNCESQARKKMITPSLDKSLLNIIQDACRDETLFGNKLPEKIKASKVIEKQGLQIKKAVSNSTPAAPNSSRTTQNRGNGSAPPRYASSKCGRGGGKKSTSSTRKTHPPPSQPSKPTNKPQTRAQTQQ